MDTPLLHFLFIHCNTTICSKDKDFLFSLLSDDEKHQFTTLQSEIKKTELLVSRCAVQALGKIAGFDACTYNTAPTVLCSNQTWYVSLSHTHNAVAVSLFHTRHGIDIEPCKRPVAYQSVIIKRYFAPSEHKYINYLPWGKTKRFLNLWTRKEAIIKSQELSPKHALTYDTVANPHKLLLVNFLVLKKYICAIAIGDSYHGDVLIRKYTMNLPNLCMYLGGYGRYRIRTSDLLHVRQAL